MEKFNMEEEAMIVTDPTISVTAAKRLDKKFLADLDSPEAVDTAIEIRNTLAFKRLGFKTWAAWFKDRTNNHIMVMKEQVEQRILELAAQGESQRAIAKKTGVSQNKVGKTIRNQVNPKRQLGSSAPTPAPVPAPPTNVTPITAKFHKRFTQMADDLDYVVQKTTEDKGFAAAAYDQIDLLTQQRDQLITLVKKLHKQFDNLSPMDCAL
jgi:hypothetical protein